MIWIFAFVTALAAYLIGSVNSGIIISKIISGKDIRESGSGNAGATNMLRTHGKKAGALTLVCDMLKGAAAVLFAILITFIVTRNIRPEDYKETLLALSVFGKNVSDFEVFYLLPNLKYIAAMFVVLGHIFPVFFKFKGGKGIATSAAVILVLNWKIGLIVLVLSLAVMAVSRYVSLGSVTGAIAYPLILTGYLIGRGGFWETKPFAEIIFSVLLAFVCVYKHKANIKRLVNGEENKLGQKKEAQ